MRTILFRGKSSVTKEWVYGYLLKVTVGENDIDVIVPHGAIINDLLLKENIYQVDSETVGQYTGLTDINGKRIYEGDIVTLNLCKKDISIVMFGEYKDCNTEYDDVYLGFYIKFDDLAVKRYCETDGNIMFPLEHLNKKYEIIGNIYDNPELLPEQLENFEN